MPRYVILEHDHPFLHWDLMLEYGPALRTWRLLAPPCPGKTVAAEAIGDHRRAYLDYEGPVSGGRGVVIRWDWGTFEEQPSARLEGERVGVILSGKRWQAVALLEKSATGQWSFHLEPITRSAGEGGGPVAVAPDE
jgi:DNA polymerase Ligase (LigD)